METNQVIAPQKNKFETARKLGIALIIIELIGVLISIAIAVFDCLSKTSNKYLDITNVLLISSVITAILLFTISNIFSVIFQKAEEVRRSGFLDNSLGCRTALTDSRNYYNNDDNSFGFKKLLLNLHENSFFTSEITGRMLFVRGILLIPVSGLLVYIFIVGLNNVAWGILFFSVVFSSRFITQFLKLCDLHIGSEKIEQDCHVLYIHINSHPQTELGGATHEIINLQSKYDVLLSKCEIILSTKIYKTKNEPLTLKWNEIKARFND